MRQPPLGAAPEPMVALLNARGRWALLVWTACGQVFTALLAINVDKADNADTAHFCMIVLLVLIGALRAATMCAMSRMTGRTTW